jgi:glycosyltransferase involved in cell wall biosynthesis
MSRDRQGAVRSATEHPACLRARLLTILTVAYPLAAVGDDAVGGAEQVASSMDSALVAAGHRSIVVACEGSHIAGEHVATPKFDGELNDEVRRKAWDAHSRAIRHALERYPVDVVHMHGIDWHEYMPEPGPPLLATLHLPAAWYPRWIYDCRRPRTFLNFVSEAQKPAAPAGWVPAFVVQNGVPLERLQPDGPKRDYALTLGRICPEKGQHLAADAARRAGIRIVISGQVYRYPSHVEYFDREIAPRIGTWCDFTGPVGFDRKRRLLAGAKCLLVPSLAPETSSLVSMEAMACGTPVIAFPTGALPEIVEHGRTGFIVGDAGEMADAIRRAGEIDPAECVRVARERFPAARMARDYIALYENIVV